MDNPQPLKILITLGLTETWLRKYAKAADLTAEAQRATAAEAAIEAQLAPISASVTAESTRAQNEEARLSAGIAAEAIRATTKEQALENAISSETNTRAADDATLAAEIATEKTRAEAAETTLSTAITTEKNRAIAREDQIASGISGKQDKIDINLQTLTKTTTGAINEILTRVNEKPGEAPQDGKTYGRKNAQWVEVTGGGGGGGIPEAPKDGYTYGRKNGDWTKAATATDITNAVAVETARAQRAEELLGTTLDGKITNEITNRQNADALLQPKTDNNLATTDKTVVGAINENKGRIDTVEGDVADIETAMSNLQSKTDASLETTADTVVGAINEVNSAVGSEATTRENADTALGGRIDGLTETDKNTWESNNTPLDNTNYNLGELASLTVNEPATNTKGICIYFECGATATTFNVPAAALWIDSSETTVEANKKYMLVILNHVWNLMKLKTL